MRRRNWAAPSQACRSEPSAPAKVASSAADCDRSGLVWCRGKAYKAAPMATAGSTRMPPAVAIARPTPAGGNSGSAYPAGSASQLFTTRIAR